MTARYFTTLKGQPVQLKPIGYWDSSYASKRGVVESESGNRKRDCGTFAIGELDGTYYFADRVIFRKSNPSNHKCGPRCRDAKGHDCECSCGGKFHGAGGAS